MEKEFIEDEPIEVLALSRVKHQKWNKGKKADIVVCGESNWGWSDEVKCEDCGKTCYYSSNENLDLKKDNIKKICLDCALGKYRKYLNEEQIKILEMTRE